MNKPHIALLGLALLWGPAHAGDEPVAGDPRVQDALAAWTAWVEYQAAIEGVPAVSLGAVRGQETLLAEGIGLANREDGVEATATTRYGICSISKLFTSIAVMQLRDGGRLDLDDPVRTHLPWFDLATPADGEAPITVRSLLDHTSGASRESGLSYWGEPGFPFPTDKQLEKQIPKLDPLYPAEHTFQYSNFAMSILGRVVEAAADGPYDAYVSRWILEPLGMSATTTRLPKKLHGTELAVGYSARRRDTTRVAVEPYDGRGMRYAMGFASNVEDLSTFLKWQFRLRDRGGDEVLRAATLREMQRVQWTEPDWSVTWGYGFRVDRYGAGTRIGHEGWCPGYRTAVFMDPDTEVGVVVLTNANDVDPVYWATEGLELLGPAVTATSTPPPARDPELDRYAGVYDYAPHGELAITRWGEGLAMHWLGTRDPSGDVVKFVKADAPHTFRHLRADGGLGEPLEFLLDADGEVTALVHEDNRIPRTGDLGDASIP